MPQHYSAADTYLGATPCKAFIQVMHQGNVRSCAIYTSASVMSARMCMQFDRESSIDNTVFSPRQNGDCWSRGWSTTGSDTTLVAQSQTTEAVEEWCAPFRGEKEGPCDTDICTEGMRYGGIPGTAATIFGIPAMMAEILKNGPGIATIEIGDDYQYIRTNAIYSQRW